MSTRNIGHIVSILSQFNLGIDLDQIREHAYILTRLIQDPRWVVPTKVNLYVENHVAIIPSEIIDIIGLSYNGLRLTRVNNVDGLTTSNYKMIGNRIYTGLNKVSIQMDCRIMLMDEDGDVLIPDSLAYITALKYRILHAEMEKQLVKSTTNSALALAQQFGQMATSWTEKCIAEYKMGPLGEFEHSMDNAYIRGSLGSMGINRHISDQSLVGSNHANSLVHYTGANLDIDTWPLIK